MTQNASQDQTRHKVSQHDTTHGEHGEHHLIRGQTGQMRLWHREEPDASKPESVNDYETLGYVIEGRAELLLDGQSISLEPGDSYCVPSGARHTYRITETLTAVEVISLPPNL